MMVRVRENVDLDSKTSTRYHEMGLMHSNEYKYVTHVTKQDKEPPKAHMALYSNFFFF